MYAMHIYVCTYVHTYIIDAYVLMPSVCVCARTYTHVTTGGDDYITGPFNVIIPTGETSVSYNISLVNDDIFEANETFFLRIDPSSLPSRVLVQPDCATVVTIVDDDGELFYYKISLCYLIFFFF